MFDQSRHRASFCPGDSGLPGALDGYAVARALRHEPALAGTYLLAWTGTDMRRTRPRPATPASIAT
jgi:hypothetical protein